MAGIEATSLENVSGIDPSSIEAYLRTLTAQLDGARDGREPIVYLVPAIEYIGHVCQDAHAIKTLFDPAKYQLFFLTHRPASVPNPSMLEVVLRGITMFVVEDGMAEWNLKVAHARLTRGLAYKIGAYTFLLGGHGETLRESYHAHLTGGGKGARFGLTPEETERRDVFMRKCGVGTDDRVAVLHVRDGGYWSRRPGAGSDAFNDFRNADVANYTLAIASLIERGFFVVRIGDAKMKRSGFAHERFLDAPFAESYDPFVDVAVLSRCDLFIHSLSGPTDFARGFDSYRLCVNTYYSDHWVTEGNDMFLPRRYVSARDGREMSVPDLLNANLSGLVDSKQLVQAGVRLVENAPDEILAATKEAIERMGPAPSSTPASKAFRTLAKAEHEMRAAGYHPKPSRRHFCMWNSEVGMASVALEGNPRLFDGELVAPARRRA